MHRHYSHGLKSLAGVCVVALSACASAPKGDPAMIIDKPDVKSRLALQNAICKSLGVSYVVLADDALTRDSTLIIEPTRIREFEGRSLRGRETRMPETFHLIKGKNKNECVLVFDRTGGRTILADTRCKEK